MVKLHLVCGVLLFAFLGWAHGLPVKEQELEEVLTKLQELKRLNDGNDQVQIFPSISPIPTVSAVSSNPPKCCQQLSPCAVHLFRVPLVILSNYMFVKRPVRLK